MLQRFGVSLEKDLLAQFDKALGRRGFENRSDGIRRLIRDMLVTDEWKDEGQDVVGSVSLVYDHDTLDLAKRLTRIQHESHTLIVSSMHVHLDAHHCLETLVIRGKPREVQRVADRLIHARGVLHGALFRTSLGRHL
jgi:CopG family nickel-responsive transcriptional regulator